MVERTHTWVCKCGGEKPRQYAQYCDTCHVARGGNLCICGKQILRGDSVCRDCWSGKMGARLRMFRGIDDGDEEGQTAMSIEDGKMTLLNMELIEGKRWWRDLLSDEAREGLEAWLEERA